VSGALCKRAVLSPTGHAAVDQAWISPLNGVGPDTEAIHNAWAKSLDQDVCPINELHDELNCASMFQVDGDGSPAPVQDLVADDLVRERTDLVRTVEPDDVSPQVREQHGAKWTRADRSNLNNSNSLERAPTLLRG
jgi:hypothetical protein